MHDAIQGASPKHQSVTSLHALSKDSTRYARIACILYAQSLEIGIGISPYSCHSWSTLRLWESACAPPSSTTSMWSSAPQLPAFSPWLLDIFSTLFSSDRKNSSQAQSKTLMVSPRLHSLQFSRVQQTTLQPNTFRSVSSLSLPWVRGWEHQKTLKNQTVEAQHTHLASSCLGGD